jgi:hypothetical protein
MPRQALRLVCAAAAATLLAACGSGDCNHGGTATPSAVASPTASPVTNTATQTPVVVPATPTRTSVPSATVSATPSATVPPTATATPPATATPSETGTPSLVMELEATGIGQYLGTSAAVTMTAGPVWDSYSYDPLAELAICLRGSRYQVEVHHGTNNKVLLYLEGGGACWNYQTCWGSPTAKLTADPTFGDGILNFSNPDNPFRDWNVVYAPYCDGSVFGGDHIADYQGNKTYHHGIENLSAAVAMLRDQFPDPEMIAVMGSSAGGYGTYSGYGVTRVAFPDTPIVVLDDSGPGLQNHDETQAIADRNENWRFQQFVPPSCTQCADQITYLSEWAIDRDPTLRVGYFSNLQDAVIRTFNNLSGPAYEALLLQVTGDLHSRQPDRFKRFYVQGESHTILELPTFYTTEVDGIRIRDWAADLITDGPAWQDIIEGFNPFVGFNSARYADPSLWLCRPDLPTDQCRGNDLDATAIQPDGSLVIEPHVAAPDPGYDCFYIYPTVDLSGTPGNHTDFSDVSLELDPLLSQAARFTGQCRVFAPLYRQVTIGTYGSPDPPRQSYFDLAYSDVEDAFKQYMARYNHGRDFVIMGHSQGTFMVTQLLQNIIDPDPRLRARLISALLIGGSVTVPDGETVGGTFQNLPLCTSADQTGCVIAYRSYAEGFPPANGSNAVGGEGMDTACTNPAALGGGKAYFAETYLPLIVNQPLFRIGTDTGFSITTPFAAFPAFYTGECVKDDRGKSYLQIGVEPQPGDQRHNPIPFDAPVLSPAVLGTHILDYNFALGDLIPLVQHQAALLQAGPPPPP